MKMWYVANVEDTSDWWEPEYTAYEHIIYAHDAEAAKEFYSHKHYGYLCGEWEIEIVGEDPTRKRQGFAAQAIEDDLCWQRFCRLNPKR